MLNMAVILERDMKKGKNSLNKWKTQAQQEAIRGTKFQEIDSQIMEVTKSDEAMAVRYSLYLLELRAPGNCVEVRVSPWGAVKILEGPESDPHNLTPPDVIELEPSVWLRLVCAISTWDEEKEAGNISAMGERDNLSAILPLEI